MTRPAPQPADAGTARSAVWAVLGDRRWHTRAEIVDATGLLPLAVRSALRDLAGHKLVRRSINGGWQITTTTRVEGGGEAEGRAE